MRHAEGGGLTAEDRSRREKVRLQAASMFEQDIDAVRIAKLLRVSTKSVYQWRRAWRTGGDAVLVSKGQGGYACKLDEQQLSRLRALDTGPAAYRWTEDQRWTLSRIAALIGRLFHVSYYVAGRVVPAAPDGVQRQVPANRAAERDEDAIAAWRKNGLGNLAASTIGQLAATVANRLRRIQHRPDLITGFLGQTGLSLEPGSP